MKESPFDYINGLAPNFGINFFNGVNLTPVGQLESNSSEFSKKNVISLLPDMSKRKPKHILSDELAKFLTDKKISSVWATFPGSVVKTMIDNEALVPSGVVTPQFQRWSG